MKRWFAALATVAAFLLPGVASAHPLGNFTVNHYARIQTSLDGVRIDYVLDEAEIPTFQDQARFQADPDTFADERAAAIGANLHLTLDGRPVALQLDSRSLSFPEGAGGLPTLRLEASYSASFAEITQATRVELRDDNDPTRIGWREIIAVPEQNVAFEQSSVPSSDVTDALRQYPEDLLNSPLDVRAATLTLAPGGATASAVVPAIGGSAVIQRAQSTFAELANADQLTPAFLVFAVGVALVLGAAHALQPGHGKTVVAAYLVGSRGTARHAVFLGATVTATHTAGVYALGLVTLALSQYILPERLYPILEAASGVLVLGIGVWLFGQRALNALGLRNSHGHRHRYLPEGESHQESESHSESHGHDTSSAATHHHDEHHHHPHGHAHTHEPRVGWRSLLALGISGGILPCPEALMVLLITIAAHRVLFGLLLIVSFSTGLAAVLVGFGLLLVYARTHFQKLNLSTGLVPRLLPVASAFVIVIAGSVITAQALPQVL